MVELVLEDDGPGIPEQLRAVIFERFHRLDDARAADIGGSGLGLAIVSEIVERLGGSVIAEAGAAGARIVVRLLGLDL